MKNFSWSLFFIFTIIFLPLVARAEEFTVDTDGDGLTDDQEINLFYTDREVADTDDDGKSDYDEVMRATDPLDVKNTNKLSRRLEVDLTSQQLYYIVDEKTVLAVPVSTGNPRTPTPPGNYKILYKVPIMRYIGPGYNLPGVKWNMDFRVNGYFLHTAYWHNNFGKKTNSHGCINMREADAALLYKYITVGTSVVVVGKTPVNGIVVVK